MAVEKQIIDVLRERIKADYKQRFPTLASEANVKIDIIRRIVHNLNYSPTMRNVEPLLKHFGYELVDKRKRKGKAVN